MSYGYAEERDEGMGLDEFLNYDPDAQKGGGGGTWLAPWKKRRQIDVWLHTESRIRAAYNHQIPFEIEVDEKDQGGEKTGRKVLKLSWPRFVSPDFPSINSNQYFREGSLLRELYNKDPKSGKLIGGSQATAFMRDPFLLLREYLWHAIEKNILSPDAVVFEWVDHKNRGELIQWTAGELSRKVKRGFRNRGHSLDSKLEYIFVVVDNDKPGDGPKITRETKLVGDKMRAEIKRQIESRGEEGDPFRVPYCFRWKFDPDASSPMNSYEVFRMDKNACTAEIWQAIGGAPDPDAGENWDIVEAPDTAEYARVNDGDAEKVRQCFERAAQVDLPLDAIFSEDWEERRAVATGALMATSSAPRSSASSSRPNPGAEPGASRPASRPSSSAAPASAERAPQRRTVAASSGDAPASAAGPRPRRKKKVAEEPPPPPPKEPEVEKIPCDGPDNGPACGYMLLPTEAKCPKCGTEYEIGPEEVPPEPVQKPQPAAPSGAKRPSARSAEEQQQLEETSARKCVACQSERLEKTTENGETVLRCGNCGCDQGDDIPF